jgi:nitrite reductase/ring-hydroxylating ferredoxin subunit/uncharacterized membrane protein
MTVESLRDVTHVLNNLSPEQTRTLDDWAGQLQGVLNTAVEQGGPAARRVKNWLNGVWLDHPLHPALTDFTVGAWCTGAVLDLVGIKRGADAAITAGVLSAVPTALSGSADWVDAGGESKRMGFIHAILNTVGLGLMLGSLFARRADQRGLGIVLSTIGLGLASFSAWVGGELVYKLGTNVSRNAFQPGAEQWQAVASADALTPGKLVGAEVEVDGTKVPVVLLKQGASIMAINGTCSHWGGPLAEGKLLDGDCVQCPWHGSQFSMRDGSVLQGPASVPQPTFDVRVQNGQVEVRQRSS